jgi:WbqC-like protein family
MPPTLLELHYLPSISWFSIYLGANRVLLDAAEHYTKQTYRNRAIILGANGPETLTVPVLHTGSKQKMADIQIDHTQSWAIRHWRTIQSAYGRAPFFAFFGPELEEILLSEKQNLFELNEALLTYCLKCLKVPQRHGLLHEWIEKKGNKNTHFQDFRDTIHPKNNGIGFRFQPYHQVFGKVFAPGLSVLDVLFCTGPEAAQIIAQTIK